MGIHDIKTILTANDLSAYEQQPLILLTAFICTCKRQYILFCLLIIKFNLISEFLQTTSSAKIGLK